MNWWAKYNNGKFSFAEAVRDIREAEGLRVSKANKQERETAQGFWEYLQQLHSEVGLSESTMDEIQQAIFKAVK